MFTRKPLLAALTITTALAAVTSMAAFPAQAQDQERQSLRWATAGTGSYGYAVAAGIAGILEDALGDYTVTVNPYPSTSAAMIAAMNGDAEIGYTASIGMSQLYAGVGPFEGFEPDVGMLVHTWYAYPMETFMAVPAEAADQYSCWSDFSGLPIYATPAGFMNWLTFQRVFEILGLEFNHVEIDSATVADALAAGSIVGAVAYTTAGTSLPAYWVEAELRADVTLIGPCADEVEALTEAGLTPRLIDPTVAFTQDVGVDEILGTPVFFAYNVRADIPEDVVYGMVNGFYEQRDELAASDAGFGPLAANYVEIQANGVAANPHIPVHPGLARFLMEHGAWNDDWMIAE